MKLSGNLHIGPVNVLQRCDSDDLKRIREMRRAGNVHEGYVELLKLYERYPMDVRVWHEQALFMLAMGEWRRAQRMLEEVVVACPNEPEPYAQLGEVETRMGNHAVAVHRYSQAVTLHRAKSDKTGAVAAMHALALAYHRLGKPYEARHWEKQVRLAGMTDEIVFGDQKTPALGPNSRYSAALCLLANGQWERGWQLFEARLDTPEHKTMMAAGHGIRPEMLPPKRWNGRTKERVVLIPEQGMGDFLWSARYFGLAASVSGRDLSVVVTKPSILPALDADWRDDIRYIGRDQLSPACADSYAHVMSLPHLLGLPEPVGPSPSVLRFMWQPSARSGIPLPRRIGVVWHGERMQANDKDRSAPSKSTLWFPLSGLPNVELVNLQAGEDGFHPENFLDTMTVAAEMDLIVTVDTAIMHLAGTMGIPTIVIPPTMPDWRWTLPKTSPWYPTLRAVRRRNTGDWDDAMRRVAELAEQVLDGKELTDLP